MKILTALKYCPVTGNIPMTCTEDGFLESCKSFRKLKSVSGGKNMKFTYCAVCNGRQRPKDLTIISLAAAQSAREKQEDNVDKKKDECEMCGKRANLRSVHKWSLSDRGEFTSGDGDGGLERVWPLPRPGG